MKNLLFTLVIIMALIFTGMESSNAQMNFYMVVQTLCDDNCTTQEECMYKFSWILIDQCGEENEIYCQDSTYVKCENMTEPYTLPVQCQSCEGASHDPCLFLAGKVQKVCIGPGGPHIICEDTDYKYVSCYDFVYTTVTLDFSF